MEIDYWNEASEVETGLQEGLYASSPPGEMDQLATTITDMIPLITTLAVVGMMMQTLSRMSIGGRR